LMPNCPDRPLLQAIGTKNPILFEWGRIQEN
jgi:hypothetical protein